MEFECNTFLQHFIRHSENYHLYFNCLNAFILSALNQQNKKKEFLCYNKLIFVWESTVSKHMNVIT